MKRRVKDAGERDRHMTGLAVGGVQVHPTNWEKTGRVWEHRQGQTMQGLEAQVRIPAPGSAPWLNLTWSHPGGAQKGEGRLIQTKLMQ